VYCHKVRAARYHIVCLYKTVGEYTVSDAVYMYGISRYNGVVPGSDAIHCPSEKRRIRIGKYVRQQRPFLGCLCSEQPIEPPIHFSYLRSRDQSLQAQATQPSVIARYFGLAFSG